MNACSFEQFLVDQVPHFDELILEESKPSEGWLFKGLDEDPLIAAMKEAERNELLRKIMAGEHGIKDLAELDSLEELKRRLERWEVPREPEIIC